MSCPYGSRITSTKQAAEAAREETKRLKEEVRTLKSQLQSMTDAFNRLAAVVETMGHDLRDIRQELYPTVEDTKPALKAPGGQP